jgi:hypothetical protein
MRKADGLSFIFIDFYAPTLIPRLNRTNTSLQSSENITLFAVCRIYTGATSKETELDTRCLGRIIYIRHNMGDRVEPCGTDPSSSLLVITPQHGLRRKRLFRYCCSLVAVESC